MNPALTRPSSGRPDPGRLYLIWTVRPGATDWAPAAAALASGAVDLLQFRPKGLPGSDQRALGRRARAACRDAGVGFVVNDDAALAVALDADGVHVGEHDLPVDAARAIVGPDRLVGVSTHDADELRGAAGSDADYAGLGPCFATATKDLSRTPGGAALVADALSSADGLPVFPIGGITASTLPAVVAAGATRVAVGAGILEADDPAAAALEIRRLLSGPPGTLGHP